MGGNEIESLTRALRKYARDVEELRDRGADLWTRLEEMKKPAPAAGDPAKPATEDPDDDGNPFRD